MENEPEIREEPGDWKEGEERERRCGVGASVGGRIEAEALMKLWDKVSTLKPLLFEEGREKGEDEGRVQKWGRECEMESKGKVDSYK